MWHYTRWFDMFGTVTLVGGKTVPHLGANRHLGEIDALASLFSRRTGSRLEAIAVRALADLLAYLEQR